MIAIMKKESGHPCIISSQRKRKDILRSCILGFDDRIRYDTATKKRKKKRLTVTDDTDNILMKEKTKKKNVWKLFRPGASILILIIRDAWEVEHKQYDYERNLYSSSNRFELQSLSDSSSSESLVRVL